MAGLKLSKIAVADISDLPPDSSSSALSLPNPSAHNPTVTTNIPSVHPLHLFFHPLPLLTFLFHSALGVVRPRLHVSRRLPSLTQVAAFIATGRRKAVPYMV